SRGLIRFRKTNPSDRRVGINFYTDTLKNEDRGSEVIDVITKLTGLVTFLKISGVQYLEEHDQECSLSECYVSPLLLSYWIEKWDRFNGSTLDDGFWDSVTYNGDVRSLERKMVEITEYWSRFESISGLKVFFPQKSYILIQDVTESIDPQLPFTDYEIEFFPISTLATISDLRTYVSARKLSLIHIIPHYLIYHAHNFKTSDDMTHYLEWSVYRAQNELHEYTNSITNHGGLRFTRGVILNESSTDYQLFLNLVLWNTPHFQFLSRDRDYLQWKGILTHAFHQFVHAYPDFEFIFDGHYSAPAFQREYIQLKLRELEFSNDRAERLSLILQNYLSVSYDATFPQPQKRFIGRDEYGQVYAQPTTFSELPSGGELNPLDQNVMRFVQFRISRDAFKVPKPLFRRSLLGGICVPTFFEHPASVNFKHVLRRINDIRELEHLRSLVKTVVPVDLTRLFLDISNSLLQDTEVTVSFWFGLLLHFTSNEAMIDNVISAGEEDIATYGLECSLRRSALNSTPIRINNSTPKLISVLDSIFHYWSGVSQQRIPTSLSELKKMFRKVLILGAVDNGDPLAEILKRYFHSSVSQVGALGSGPVIRAEVGHFEFNVSYTSIISDIDIGSITSQDDLNNFLDNILIKYMRNVEPQFATFKINYAGSAMIKYILNYLQANFVYFYTYTISFITPQFGRTANYEKYLTFLKYDNSRHVGKYLQSPAEETHVIRDLTPLNALEQQCHDLEEFQEMQFAGFPRVYFFVISSGSDVKAVLTLLSHRSDRIITSKSFGSDSIAYYSTLSPARIRLCRRVPKTLEMTAQLSERFDASHLSSSAYVIEREERVLSLGNFYRELCRVQILVDDQGPDVLSSLDTFLTTNEGFHYVGVGDERARNILCIPPTSPYTILDMKHYPQLEVFDITCQNAYFPFSNPSAIDALVEAQFSKYQK
ncbi:Prenyclcysteine oxidase-like, partial [Tubulinosema ratisbonensis]